MVEVQYSPLISIIIPTLNRENLLKKAVNSVLSQSYRNFELIIVQNGAIEHSKKLIKQLAQQDLRVRYIYDPVAGSANARNLGVHAARGELIAFLDDDDQWLPDKLKNQVNTIENNPEFDLISCHSIDINENGEVLATPGNDITDTRITFKDLVLKGCLIHSLSGVMVRKRCFEEVGYFNKSYPIADDYEFYLRVAESHPMLIKGEVLYKYLKHSTSLSGNRKLMCLQSMNILRGLANAGGDAQLIEEGIKQYAGNYWAFLGDDLANQNYRTAAKGYWDLLAQFPFVGLYCNWCKVKNPVCKIVQPYVTMLKCVLRSLTGHGSERK